MLTLSAKIRNKDEKIKLPKKENILAGVLYGPEIKNITVILDLKEFKKIYSQAGESSLLSLEEKSSEDTKKTSKFSVLVHDIQFDPISGEPKHVDFYQPVLTKEVEVSVPIVFEGESSAVKDLAGTLVKEIQELRVKALPKDLPHEIRVNINSLKNFYDKILIKDLSLPDTVKIQKKLDEILATVVPPAKVEEELAKPIEEKVEEVEKVEKKEKKEEEVAEDTETKPAAKTTTKEPKK